MTEKNERRTGDKTGILFGLTVLTIVGIILFMVITAFASTEAGPTDAVSGSVAGPTATAGDTAPVLSDEQKHMLSEYLGKIVSKTKTGEVEAGTSTCAVTFYRKKLFGLFPRQTTHILHYRGVDFSKITVENLHIAFAKTTEMDCGGCEKLILKEWQDDIVALKVRCPLKNGEWDFAIRKN